MQQQKKNPPVCETVGCEGLLVCVYLDSRAANKANDANTRDDGLKSHMKIHYKEKPGSKNTKTTTHKSIPNLMGLEVSNLAIRQWAKAQLKC